jgi:hypothetical protein
VEKIERDREGTRGRRRKSAARRTSQGIYRARGDLIVNEDVELRVQVGLYAGARFCTAWAHNV